MFINPLAFDKLGEQDFLNYYHANKRASDILYCWLVLCMDFVMLLNGSVHPSSIPSTMLTWSTLSVKITRTIPLLVCCLRRELYARVRRQAVILIRLTRCGSQLSVLLTAEKYASVTWACSTVKAYTWQALAQPVLQPLQMPLPFNQHLWLQVINVCTTASLMLKTHFHCDVLEGRYCCVESSHVCKEVAGIMHKALLPLHNVLELVGRSLWSNAWPGVKQTLLTQLPTCLRSPCRQFVVLTLVGLSLLCTYLLFHWERSERMAWVRSASCDHVPEARRQELLLQLRKSGTHPWLHLLFMGLAPMLLVLATYP